VILHEMSVIHMDVDVRQGSGRGGHGDQRSTPASTRVMLGVVISNLHYNSLSVSYLAISVFVTLLC
jgi:hypothetical protein